MTKEQIGELLDNPEIIRSNRKSISISITPEGTFQAKVPVFMSDKEVKSFIYSKADKLGKMLQKYLENIPEPMKFETGAKFLYLGKYLPLQIVKKSEYGFKFQDDKFYMTEEEAEYGEAYFEQFYRDRAKEHIPPRVREIAGFYKLPIKNVKISSARKRWGSCSSAGNINIAWRLIMAPPRVIDAVIVHELVHRIHMNHSKAFYALVEKAIPDYKECDKWLDKNVYAMSWI